MRYAIALLLLTGCGSLETKKVDHKPLYNHRADMQISLDGKEFDGMAVSRLDGVKRIKLLSKAKLDVFVVSSCQRYDKLERLDKNWFGGSGKGYIYEYSPSPTEKEKGCPIYFEAFDKTGLTDWGYVLFTNKDLTAISECSGVISQTIGATVCQVKNGFEQAISFKDTITYVESSENCNLVRKSDRSFSYRPSLGFCIATFYDGVKMHTLHALGFDQIFVRAE